jgi:hypothetical protein
MTLDELLGCSADVLEKMSPKELEEHFKPYFDVTRPERARLQKPKSHNEPAPWVSPNKKRALEALSNIEGFDMSFLKKRKKK